MKRVTFNKETRAKLRNKYPMKHTEIKENIRIRAIEDEVKENVLDYSMSVILDRAIPRLQDGLKPVQRRILYAMKDVSYKRKSARLVGEVLGKYHAHGDKSVYDAMVRLIQPFKMYVPYMVGQGNYGSLDADDAVAAYRYCLTGDAVIKTKTYGDISYDELAKMHNLTEPYTNADIDIEVKSMNGVINKSTKLFHSGFHPTMELTLRNGLKIRGTYNHPVLTVVNAKSLQWKTLDTITKNDVIVIDSSHDQFIEDSENSLLEARFLGCMVSEGYISGDAVAEKGDYRIGVSNTDMDIINPVVEYARTVLGKELKITERKIKSESVIYEACFFDKDFREKMIKDFSFGTKSSERGLPKNTRYRSKEYLCELLKYLFEGDGSVKCTDTHKNSGYICYSTISKTLARDISNILLDLGIEVTISEDRGVRIGKNYKEIKLYISNRHNVVRFYEMIGFVSKRKNEELHKLKKLIAQRKVTYNSPYTTPYDSSTLSLQSIANQSGLEAHGDNVYDILEQVTFLRRFYRTMRSVRVKDIKHTGEVEAVYSIRVDSECHSYVSNGIISHNTEVDKDEISELIFRKYNQLGILYKDNYDNTMKEPKCLAPPIPMLLVNGAIGIAVGMATYIPTHNPYEVINAYEAYIKCELKNDNIRKYLKAPDPVIPCYVIDRDGIDRAYKTGSGKYHCMSYYHIEDDTRGKKKIVFTSVLPNRYKDNDIRSLVDKCRDQRNPLSQMVADIADESSKEGIRMVVVIKKDIKVEDAIEALIAARFCYDSFTISMRVIDEGRPIKIGIMEMMKRFHKSNRATSERHLEALKGKKEERIHILDGLELAITNYDGVISIIRKSKDKESSMEALVKKYKIDEKQAAAILDTKLVSLVNKGDSIKEERKILKAEVKEINLNLKDIDGYIINIIKELKVALKPYSKRRCKIIREIPKTPL